MGYFHYAHRHFRNKFIPQSLPPAGIFDGKRVLVTGGTTGLGLAAAIHFARLGAEVMITCRNISNIESAKQKVETGAKIIGQGKVHVMQLDMDYYFSCVSFVEELKKNKRVLDFAVLNAGCINPDFVQSPEGWEQTIQVNTLSTALLGILLLSWMKQEQTPLKTPPHLVFVTSRDHVDADITKWSDWAQGDGILRNLSKKENSPQPHKTRKKRSLLFACQRAASAPEATPDRASKSGVSDRQCRSL